MSMKEKVGEFASDGESFVMSNGTSSISFRNTETFEIERTISVTDSFGNLINRINELECVNTPEWSKSNCQCLATGYNCGIRSFQRYGCWRV